MGEEIGKFEGSYRITEGLLQKFGKKRVVDTPIAEEGFVGLAAGAAMLGLRPVVEIMTINFILVAVDQIVNHASKIHYMFGGQARVPLVIRTPSGGVGQLAATHSQSFENWFAYCPGLKVVAPVDAVRRQGPAAHRHPRRRPGHLHREPAALRHQGRGAGGRRLHRADRHGRGEARGHRHHRGRLLAHDRRRDAGGAEAGRERASASRSSTCARCVRSTGRRSSIR